MSQDAVSLILREFPELEILVKSAQTLATYAEEGWTVLEEEAKERQRGGQGGVLLGQKIDQATSGPGAYGAKPLVENFPQAVDETGTGFGRGVDSSVKELTELSTEPKRATAQAAAITGTNRQYVSDAKRISNVSWAETHFRPFLSALPRTDYKKRHPAQ